MHKDYLGTILAITDEKGKLVEERHFDAWGNLIHGSMQVLDRGYASHEHLQEVGLIHMNGRLYDPMLRLFLNADENIQDPTNTQCYNKYGYVMNNPLMFNDPSGEIGFLAFLAIPLVKAILIGAAVGAESYLIGMAATGNIDNITLGGALKATFWGAVSGAATFGVGSIFSTTSGTATALASNIAKVSEKLGGALVALVQAGTHAVTQGVLSLMQGGDFGSAALSGGLGSLGASTFGAMAPSWSKSAVGTIGFGALSGGIGAKLSGGNFWRGVVIGGMVAGLNHGLHKMKEKVTLDRAIRKGGYGKILDDDPYLNWSNEEIGEFASKVFPDLYESADCPGFEKQLMIGNNPDIAGQAQALRSGTEGNYSIRSLGKILIRSNVLNSIRQLGKCGWS